YFVVLLTGDAPDDPRLLYPGSGLAGGLGRGGRHGVLDVGRPRLHPLRRAERAPDYREAQYLNTSTLRVLQGGPSGRLVVGERSCGCQEGDRDRPGRARTDDR